MKRVGRPSVFAGKDIDHPRSLVQTPAGWACFERARKALARLVGLPEVSSNDTLEYLSRGHAETVEYVRKKKVP